MKKKCLLLALSVFALGVAAGSRAAVGTDPAAFSEYFAALANNGAGIKIGAVAANSLVVWLVLFFSAFFRFGAVTASLAVASRGFVDGFAVTAILRTAGAGAVGLCFFDCLGAPLTLVMCAMCMHALADTAPAGRGYLLRSVLVLLLMLLCALAGGYVSQALLKLFAARLAA